LHDEQEANFGQAIESPVSDDSRRRNENISLVGSLPSAGSGVVVVVAPPPPLPRWESADQSPTTNTKPSGIPPRPYSASSVFHISHFLSGFRAFDGAQSCERRRTTHTHTRTYTHTRTDVHTHTHHRTVQPCVHTNAKKGSVCPREGTGKDYGRFEGDGRRADPRVSNPGLIGCQSNLILSSICSPPIWGGSQYVKALLFLLKDNSWDLCADGSV